MGCLIKASGMALYLHSGELQEHVPFLFLAKREVRFARGCQTKPQAEAPGFASTCGEELLNFVRILSEDVKASRDGAAVGFLVRAPLTCCSNSWTELSLISCLGQL